MEIGYKIDNHLSDRKGDKRIKMKIINLKDVPHDLHRRAKSQAALEGRTLREFILDAIRDRISSSTAETEEQ